jgi:hypothetical protein
MFVVKVRRLHLKGVRQALPLLANIRLSWEGLPEKTTSFLQLFVNCGLKSNTILGTGPVFHQQSMKI